ncbi:MAG: fibronectin type III domain-containing protein [Verrucomicrobiae bacterium]|nr:fibronectin type III domain-containing protein [Verrucomicrobiae bacterium]
MHPPTPPAFLFSNASSAEQISLYWTTVTSATAYNIERSTDLQNWTPIATTPPSQNYYTDTQLTPNTWYHYRVKAVNTGGSSPPSMTTSSATLKRIEEWRLQNYGTTSPNGPSASLATAPDGVPNLLRFAFNLNLTDPAVPITPSTGTKGLPHVYIDTTTQKLTLEFIRRRATSTPGITYQVEFTNDLQTYTPGGSALLIIPINTQWERVLWQDSQTITQNPRRFARVRITENP